MLFVFGLIALVLVVACTNLGKPSFSHGALMRDINSPCVEALGASRWRLVREQSSESLILPPAGGLALLSWLLIQALISAL